MYFIRTNDTTFFLLFFMLIQSILFGRLPGDTDPDFRLFRGYVDVIVVDEDGNGVSGVHIMANMNIGFGTEEWGENVTEFGTTGSTGTILITLDIWAPRSWGSPSGHYIEAILTSGPNCTNVVSSSGVSSSTSYSIWPVFAVIMDCDGNGIEDSKEMTIAQTFKPIFHKHSFDWQEDLSNVDLLLDVADSSITHYLNLIPPESDPVYYQTRDPSLHLVTFLNGYGYYDSFGLGSGLSNQWVFDLPNQLRHDGAPIGERPVYYRIYKDGSNIYVQYWIFLNMNDLRFHNQTPGLDSWHEGDWEHITIQLSNDWQPQKVNFYGHYGGYTRNASECWWSSTSDETYSGIIQGWDTNHSNIHVWVAANSHALYNRNDPIYRLKYRRLDNGSFAYYYDNVDYNQSGNNLYFGYDKLENLGDIITCGGCSAHGVEWITHNSANYFGKTWLGFTGVFGDYFRTTLKPHLSPHMPPQRRGWDNFELDHTMFGNDVDLIEDLFVEITLNSSDPPDGD